MLASQPEGSVARLGCLILHKPWPYAARLIARMADSAIAERAGLSIKREPRSAGLHASDVLRLMHPQGKDDNGIDEAQLRLFGLLGLAFEDRAELALQTLATEPDWPWYAERPGEVHADGIACSPDILMVPKDGSEVRELSLKVTWKSCREWPTEEEGENDFPAKASYYLSQCMTYAYPLRTTGSLMLVYFVCGNWRPPFPKVHGWELDFSSQEVGETWDAVLSIKEGLK